MSQIKVSVIMPVYNAEEFLDQTLSDVTGQTLQEIEIICIDDGSTDSSRDIIQRWKEKDGRIQLIIQRNQFAGVARNNGIKVAKGKYAAFWDSDDIFDESALEKMYLQAEEQEADICVCAAQHLNMETGKIIVTNSYLRKDFLPEKVVFNKYDMPQRIFEFAKNNPWNKLFRMGFIREHNLEFQAIRQGNDIYFTQMALFLAERITYVDDVLITYRMNNTTSLTGNSSNTVSCIYDAYFYTLEHLKKYSNYSLVEESFLNHALNSFFWVMNMQSSFEAYQKLYDFFVENGFVAFGLKGYPKEKFHYEWQYSDMKKMFEISAGDFLLEKSNARRLSLQEQKTSKTKLKKRNARLKRALEDERVKRKMMEEELMKIKSSKAIKIGKLILWLPRKIKGI